LDQKDALFCLYRTESSFYRTYNSENILLGTIIVTDEWRAYNAALRTLN